MSKPTPAQLETLQALTDGAVLTLDQHNMLNLPTALPGRNGPMVSPSVREFLTKNRLVERLDKTRDIKANGNGYVISEKGRKVIAEMQSPN